MWIYDLRTNENFTRQQNPLTRTDLDEFVACYNPENRPARTAYDLIELAEGDAGAAGG